MIIGFPIFSLMFAYIAYKQRYERHKARFCAATRNGAKLEFGDKESLIMYLNNARTLLLNASVKQELNGPRLAEYLVRKYASYLLMRNPVSLLFEEITHRRLKGIKFLGPGVKLGKDIISKGLYDSLDPIIKR